jgi:starch-binding outer membrane protein, SusD/RagB family
MKIRKIYIILLGAMLGLVSCNDYLTISPTDSASDKLVWSSPTYAQLAVNDFYHYLYYLGNFGSGDCDAGMTEALTDEFKYGSANYNAMCYIPSEISYGGSTLTANYVDVYLGNWSTDYGYICRINEAIYKMKKYSSFTDADTKNLMGQMRFFRGYIYFDLLKRYKQVILYDENMDNYKNNTALSSDSTCWNFVEADFEYAAHNLSASSVPDDGITKGAAFAMLSRAMLYAKRWNVAKVAADSVINSGLYKLTGSYANAFNRDSDEAILQYAFDTKNYTTYHSFDSYYAPGGDKAADGNNISGGYGTPTQEMVESYELATGGFPDWSLWHNTTTGTDSVPPYSKLEPRFAASILYNGSSWKGRTIEPYVGGMDGWCTWFVDSAPDGRTTTGYYLRKMVDVSHHFTVTQNSTQPWTVIRYAEVLLNYAEACYQTKDYADANAAIRKIRARVGLPYTDKSGADLMAAIRQERKVELAFEGQYYWDMRRWGLAESVFSNYRTHGLKIVKNDDGTFTYTYVETDTKDREFPSKMYRFPLPQNEIANNSAVSQFADWK